MALNLSKLFDRPVKESFLRNINPGSAGETALKAAKEDIKEYLRNAIPLWLEQKFGEKPKYLPKFRTQGSWAYKTCNDPCQTPPQEMDWDLGIYLPVSLWEDNNVQPKFAAKAYYEMVKGLMEPLAKKNGWTLTEKPTCVRVHLREESKAHIDLPLYAAPDDEFMKIVTEGRVVKAASAADSISFADQQQIWSSLTRVALALKDGNWSPSDPGRVVLWFEKALDRHGPQLRRICRYLKAWRDHNWAKGGPSSIVLMVCAVQTMNRSQADYRGRDDLALQHVLSTLPNQLSGSVIEAMIDPTEDMNRLDVNQRMEAATKARLFHSAIAAALKEKFDVRQRAITQIQAHLGTRFPSDIDDISPDDGPTNIRTIQPEPQQRTVIVPTLAG